MSDRASLLRAVADRPDDRLVRLVYADFLDESGKPDDARRAEFIRAQCEWATVIPPRGGPQQSDVPTWDTWTSALADTYADIFADDLAAERKKATELRQAEAVQERVKKLFDEHGNGWVKEAATALGLPPPASEKINFWRVVGVLTKTAKRVGWPYSWGATSVGVGEAKGLPDGFHGLVFAGGFADELWVDPTKLAARAIVEKWQEVGPTRRLVLQQPWGSDGEFGLTADHLRGAATLTLDLQSDANVYRGLLAAHEAEVTSLELTVGYGVANTLAASDLLRSLRRLFLQVSNTNELEVLATAPAPELQELVLDFDYLDENVSSDEEHQKGYAEYVGRLARWDGSAGVETLTIQNVGPSAELVRAVLGSAWQAVTTLKLDTPLGPTAVAAFAGRDAFPHLTDLTLCLDRKTMTDGIYKAPPDPEEDGQTLEPKRRKRRWEEDAPKKKRADDEPKKPLPVARPVGALPVARPVAAEEIPVANVAPDPNRWATALIALARSPLMKRRMALTSC